MLTGKEIVNAVADTILREFFPFPNPENIHVQNAVDFLSNKEFLSYCSEENKAKIKKVVDHCSNL